MKKSRLAALLAFVLCFTVILGGCGGKKEAEKKSDVQVTEIDTFPVVNEKVTMSVFAVKNSYISDFETNEFTKWYEEKSNVHLDWIVASGDAQQSFNLMIASGDYPDLIMGMGLSREQIHSLVEQDILEDISDEIEKYGHYIKDMFNEDPTIKDYVTVDGGIYGLPHVENVYGGKYRNMMWVYKPWLEKLGIESPTNLDEFYEMLKEFKEKDPNGNGQADEIPLASRGVKYDWGIEPYLVSSFVPDDGISRTYVEDGKVKFVGVQPEYKEALRYIKKLYDEGLLYADSFILDRTQIMAIGENETPILGAAPGQYPGMFCLSNGSSERYYDFTAIQPLEGPDGFCSTTARGNGVMGNNFIVTKECPYPDVAVRWIDWFYSKEGKQKSQSDGATIIREAKEGELGFDGQQALWTKEKDPNAEEVSYTGMTQNNSWKLFGVYYQNMEESIRTYEPDSTTDPDGVWYKAYETYKQYDTNSYPQYSILIEKADEYTDSQKVLEEMESSFAKFVVGDLDIDKDWDAYVNGLKGLGLDTYISIRQESYDASLKK